MNIAIAARDFAMTEALRSAVGREARALHRPLRRTLAGGRQRAQVARQQRRKHQVHDVGPRRTETAWRGNDRHVFLVTHQEKRIFFGSKFGIPLFFFPETRLGPVNFDPQLAQIFLDLFGDLDR